MRYRYLGLRGVHGSRYGQLCDPVRRPDGKCILGRQPRNQLVRFADDARSVVPARCLRLAERGEG